MNIHLPLGGAFRLGGAYRLGGAFRSAPSSSPDIEWGPGFTRSTAEVDALILSLKAEAQRAEQTKPAAEPPKSAGPVFPPAEDYFGDLLHKTFSDKPLPSAEQLATLRDKYDGKNMTPDQYQDLLYDLVNMGVLNKKEATLAGMQPRREYSTDERLAELQKKLDELYHPVVITEESLISRSWDARLNVPERMKPIAAELDDDVNMREWLSYRSKMWFSYADETGEHHDTRIDELYGYLGRVLDKIQ